MRGYTARSSVSLTVKSRINNPNFKPAHDPPQLINRLGTAHSVQCTSVLLMQVHLFLVYSGLGISPWHGNLAELFITKFPLQTREQFVSSSHSVARVLLRSI